MRERDEDLQEKYPQLNLNEDISELDGVPAVELTDGSVLPIQNRDRYPTHVSFIEGNRIAVEDLRSGGVDKESSSGWEDILCVQRKKS